jgi:hypothetical protein
MESANNTNSESQQTPNVCEAGGAGGAVNNIDIRKGRTLNHQKAIAKSGNNKTIIRICTVIGYIISVSLAGVILSVYYIFLWEPSHHSA